MNQLNLYQFKNLDQLNFQPKKGLNFIIGKNGSGKTNLLDSIHCCCMTKSYFQYSDKNCIQHDANYFRIESKWKDKDQMQTLNIKCVKSELRQVEWNGVQYNKASEHLGKIPVVMIVPNEVYTFVNESEDRRKFLNQSLIQLDPYYFEQLNTYNQFLKQKTAALKSMKLKSSYDNVLLDAYELSMEKAAKVIYQKRKEFVDKIIPYLQAFSEKMSGGLQESMLEYYSHVQDKNMLDVWRSEREYDAMSNRIHSGIHRDKVECKFNNQNLKNFGSQGQIKTFVIALRLAQVQYLMENMKTKPILLLDDLFAKLDESRVEQLLTLLDGLEIEQCFITDTHLLRAQKIAKKRIMSSNIFVLDKNKISTHA
ncbi:MAG: DNA replication and repair protein RecF [Saprospiraceae bacterium]